MASTYELIVQATDKATRPLKQIETGLSRVEKQTKSVNTALKAAGGAIIAFASGTALRGIVNQYTAFEKYRTVLATYLGSQEKANAALDRLQKLANNLPQDLDDITQAFVTLNRFGIDTSAKSLTAFSNIATANGKSLTQLAEAVADGMTGEFERFKEFGIKVSNESGKLTAKIGNDTVAIANDTTTLINELMKLGETRFGDAAANNSDTLGQSLSNLKGAATEAAIAFSEGLAPELKKAADLMAQMLRTNKELIKSLGAGVGEAIKSIANVTTLLAESWDVVNAAIWTFIGLRLGSFIATLGGRMVRFTNGAKSASGVISGMGKAISASGAAAASSIGKFTGLTGTLALLATRAGKVASIFGLLTFSSDLNTDELEQGVYKVTNNLNDATSAMQNFAGTKDELDALISKNQEVIDATRAFLDTLDLADPNDSFIYNNLTEGLMAYNGALWEQSRAAKAAAESQDIVITGASEYSKWLNEISKTAQDNVKISGWQREAIAQITEEYDLGYISLAQYEEMKRLLGETTKETTKATLAELDAAEQLLKTRSKEIDDLFDLNMALDNSAKLAKKYGLAESEVTRIILDKINALQGTDKAMEESTAKAAEFGEAQKSLAQEIYDGIKSTSENFKTSLARDLMEGKNMLSSFKDFFGNILDQIIQKIIESQITTPFVNGIMGFADQAIGGFLSSSGAMGPVQGGGGGFLDGIMGLFRANGGPVGAGQSYIVGERGPEIFTPNNSGVITPNGEMGSGGQPVVVNFNINAIDTQTGVEFIVEQRETISAVVSNALNKTGRTGITS